MLNIIKGNFEISKQQVAELKNELNELRQSIERIEYVLEDRIACVEKKLGNLESRIQEMYDYQLDPVFIEDYLIDLEDQSRRKNLSTDGINEKPNETWEDCEKELDKLLKESLGIEEEVVIGRAHRVKTDNSKKSNTWEGLKHICAQRRLL